MTATHLNASLIAAGSVGLALAVRLVASPLVRVTAPPRVGTAPVAATAHGSVRPDSLVAALVGRDPFRIMRRPAPVAYDPLRIGQPEAPSPPKPVLLLVGIVWDGGKDPTALLEGLPATDGPRVVRSGETVGGLRVKQVGRERVVIVGMDTVWALKVREPWK
jgi:hypothetical protein